MSLGKQLGAADRAEESFPHGVSALLREYNNKNRYVVLLRHQPDAKSYKKYMNDFMRGPHGIACTHCE